MVRYGTAGNADFERQIAIVEARIQSCEKLLVNWRQPAQQIKNDFTGANPYEMAVVRRRPSWFFGVTGGFIGIEFAEASTLETVYAAPETRPVTHMAATRLKVPTDCSSGMIE